MWETWVRSLGWEDPLEKEKTVTPVFCPGEFHGLYSPRGRKEWDMTEWLSHFFFLIFIFALFYFTILYWFCHTLTWIHHGCTCDPKHEPPSHLPSHNIPLGHPRAPAPSMHTFQASLRISPQSCLWKLPPPQGRVLEDCSLWLRLPGMNWIRDGDLIQTGLLMTSLPGIWDRIHGTCQF